MKMDIKNRVFKVVSQVMNVPVGEIAEESSPDTIETWDSLQHINLVLALEEEFGASLTDQQIVDMLNVGLIVLSIKEVANGVQL